MEHICHFPGCLGGVALNGVGQGIHTGGGGQPLGHGGHHIRVDDGDYGHIVGVNADEFSLALHVGDHVVDGHLCGGSGCGGNGNDGNTGVLCGSGALKASHILKFRVGDDDADGLGRIHGGAAADGYNVVRASCFKCLYAVLHVLNGGIGLDVGVDLIGQSGLLQHIRHLGGHAKADQVRIGAYKGFFECPRLGLICNFLNRAGAVVRSFVQHDSVCHN